MRARTLVCTVLVLVLSLLFSGGADAAEETLLLRQPDMHGDRVAFVYAGDIWTAPTAGGEARKLTSHAGAELFPVFSPDGRWIAFSGEYSGSRQIWVIPSRGGEPRQLTFYPDVGSMPPRGGWDNIPVDWAKDGSEVLFRCNRTPYGKRVSRYFLVSADGSGIERPLQIPEGGPASLSADGSQLAYSIKSREFRTWKRYKAGRAQDIWIYDLGANGIDRLTSYPGTDSFPMWVDDTIYFTSDRSAVGSDEPRTLNIFAFDLSSRHIRQVTRFTDFDCLWPRRGAGGIVFENGGSLWVLDTTTDEARKLSIFVRDDRPHARAAFVDASKNISSYEISPSGKRAIFSARGEVFTVPAKNGRVRNLTRTPGVREMDVGWSPDGKWISYVSEASGEYELYLRPYHGDGEAKQITTGTDAWIVGYDWSPRSSHVVVLDTRHRLRLVDVESSKVELIDQGTSAPIGGVAWSADGRWLAYTKTDTNRISSVWLYSLHDGSNHRVTDGRFDSFSPSFDPGGEYLYLLSRRDFDRRTRSFDSGLYLLTLHSDLTSPFVAPEDDEEEEEATEENGEDGENDTEKNGKNGGEEEPTPTRVDLDGIASRLLAFPLDAGRFGRLEGVKGGVLYVRKGAIRRWSLEDREEKTVVDGAGSYVLSADGTKLLYGSNSSWSIVGATGESKKGDGVLDLSGMRLQVEPEVEWRQIYTDAWRIMRDWFYDPGMHGVDWQAMHDRYLPLVPHVSHRADLDYLLGELVGELNVGHTYVQSAPGAAQVDRVEVGVLGCDLVADGDHYRIATIFAGRPWIESASSPLRAPGVHVEEGEYLLAIDGVPVNTKSSPYRLLTDCAATPIVLTVNDRPTLDGAREVEVTPAASERELRHYHWVERNRRIVDELSGGKVGYIYVPDTSTDGFREFYQGWREQFTKHAMIIDERYNGGGQVPDPMAFDMARPVLSYWGRRHLDLGTTPFAAHEGPKVMLINGRSSSGGDAFPAYFRKLELGPLMGATTWGGLVGYSYSPRFVDGGGMAVPSFGYVNTDGEWDVEYYGVAPDIEVFDDPTLIQAGREPMLERAVEHLLAELEKSPPKKVEDPAGPDRS